MGCDSLSNPYKHLGTSQPVSDTPWTNLLHTFHNFALLALSLPRVQVQVLVHLPGRQEQELTTQEQQGNRTLGLRKGWPLRHVVGQKV